MTLGRGTLLNKRYRVIEILGQGGMGAVYRAVDENLSVDVAVKENLFTTAEYARQFRREAVILATLRHPNLTRVTDHFVVENQGQYLVMDYIEGEDLRQRMDRVGELSEEEVIIIGAALCDALSYLAKRAPPIVHRDIKPGNVKITPQGHIFLVDFGLAKIIQTGQATTTGARAMTPGYSPPEQYGTARTDHRSDLFSLGATLYAALTGSIPEDAMARAMGQAELTFIQGINPNVSKRMATVIEKSLAIRPDDRYQSALEFKEALLAVRNMARRDTGEFIVTPPPVSSPPETPALSFDAPVGSFTPLSISPPEPLPDHQQVSPRGEISGTPSLKRRKGRWVLALVAILAMLAAIIFLYDPTLPTQALALILPTSLPAASEPPPRSSATPEGAKTQSPIPLVAANITPTPSASPETPVAVKPSATLGLTSTETPIPTASPSSTATPFGGGSGEIAFASERSGTVQVWIMHIDGSNLRQVTNKPEGACQPDWSPDGQRLVYISPCERNVEQFVGSGLFVINADGSGDMTLTDKAAGDFDPDWSPDGTKIAFTSLRNSGHPRIYILDLSSGEVTRISSQYSYDRQPSWSPDGARIAFATSQKGPVQIWTMNPDGSDQTIYSRSVDAINSHPVWSPDGEVILFTQLDVPGAIPGISVAAYIDGEYSEYRYNIGPIPVREARYSPDGLWLVFESWPTGSNHDIYMMSASGAGRTRLTNDPMYDFDPVWRPALTSSTP